jgi:endonuclease VIII-like 1
MPELAEIKIMSDYINDVCEGEDFTSICVSPEVANRLSLVQPSDLQIFSITAMSRGKELILTLSSGIHQFHLSVSMGMSGYWHISDSSESPKHTHLKFKTVSGKSLCLVDARRFAKWKWKNSWSSNRGPCPLTQFGEFKEVITQNIHSKSFKKPIHLVLMDQRYFNGIGNYLRAEILFKANQDPFEEAGFAILRNPKILELCRQLPLEAYLLGGGQLKDWENPFDVPVDGFSSWIQCYGKSDYSIIDKNGRTLWYNKSQIKDAVSF